MKQNILTIRVCAVCGFAFLAALLPVHHCEPSACRHQPHTHEELPAGGHQNPQVVGNTRAVATASTSAVSLPLTHFTLR